MTRRLLIVTCALLVTLGLRSWLGAAAPVCLHHPLVGFPDRLGAWSLTREERIDNETLGVLKADDYLLRTYSNPAGKEVGIFIAYYTAQRAGESMHSPKHCLPGSGWEPIESDRILWDRDAANHPIWVNRYLVEKDDDRQLVLYWYQENGRVIASEYLGKVYAVWDAIRLGRRDGAIVRITVSVPKTASADAALSVAIDFGRACRTDLARFLPAG